MLTNTTILILIEWFRAGNQYDIPSDHRYLHAKSDDIPWEPPADKISMADQSTRMLNRREHQEDTIFAGAKILKRNTTATIVSCSLRDKGKTRK
jgi:hypothetical protein